MPVIGLTGGIASGKSTVAQLLKDKGAKIIDADLISREILVPGSAAYQRVVEHFGEAIVDPQGSIDRSALSTIVFSQPSRRRELEQITHPLIFAELRRQLERLDTVESVVLVEAALIVETAEKWRAGAGLDALVVVVASSQNQIARLMETRGLSAEQALLRIQAQATTEAKLAKADWVVRNDGSVGELAGQVSVLWNEIQSRWPR